MLQSDNKHNLSRLAKDSLTLHSVTAVGPLDLFPQTRTVIRLLLLHRKTVQLDDSKYGGWQLTKSYEVNVLKHKNVHPNFQACAWDHQQHPSATLIGIKAFTPEKPVYSVAEIYGHIRAPSYRPLDTSRWKVWQ